MKFWLLSKNFWTFLSYWVILFSAQILSNAHQIFCTIHDSPSTCLVYVEPSSMYQELGISEILSKVVQRVFFFKMVFNLSFKVTDQMQYSKRKGFSKVSQGQLNTNCFWNPLSKSSWKILCPQKRWRKKYMPARLVVPHSYFSQNIIFRRRKKIFCHRFFTL